jgi:hypothetical protein
LETSITVKSVEKELVMTPKEIKNDFPLVVFPLILDRERYIGFKRAMKR